jgi:hypothetical protein
MGIVFASNGQVGESLASTQSAPLNHPPAGRSLQLIPSRVQSSLLLSICGTQIVGPIHHALSWLESSSYAC